MKKILGMKLLSLILAGVVAAGSIGAGGYVIYGYESLPKEVAEAQVIEDPGPEPEEEAAEEEPVEEEEIEAGKSMEIYKYLNLDKFDCCVAIIKNARSNKMGRKDIIKIECPIDQIDLDALGFIDHNITINIIKDDKIVEKKTLSLPKEIHNVVSCKNTRCISSIEQKLEQVFVLTDPVKGSIADIRKLPNKYYESQCLPVWQTLALLSSTLSPAEVPSQW